MSDKTRIRLNIGCGGRPSLDYINVDMDDLAVLRKRFPHQTFTDGIQLANYDIFNLPYADGTVDEAKVGAFREHLSISEEPKVPYEVRRVLKSGDHFNFSVPDFEKVCKNWIAAKDDWKDLYRSDDEAIASLHWFGTYAYKSDNLWGYIAATVYGMRHGEGQFHKNCYSSGKIRAISERLGFSIVKLEQFFWKGDRDPMLGVEFKKQ